MSQQQDPTQPHAQPPTQPWGQPPVQLHGRGDGPWAVNPWGQPQQEDRPAAGDQGEGHQAVAGQGWGWGVQPGSPGDAAPPVPPADGAQGGQGGAAPSGGRRERRRPGWAALVAVGLAAALVGAGTALGVGALGDDAVTAAPAAATTQASGPVRAPSSADDAVDWQTVADAVGPSVVAIQVASGSAAGEGSGVVLDDDGRILTNYHVINGAGADAEMRVVLSDGRVYEDVQVVGEDAATDLAVVQVTDPPADLQPATFADSTAVQVGQPVMALGNPLGLSDTVTTGIVSALDRPVSTTQETPPEQGQQSPFDNGFAPRQQQPAEQVVTNAIQTDAAINPGNSGGALVDATGAVIGISSSIASTGDGATAGSIGLGFAIPSQEAQRIAGELVADGTAEHALLGVTLADATATADGTTRLAAVVQDVSAGSAAAQAGLRSGDAVTAVDGAPVEGAESLTARLRERTPGTAVELTVVRDGQQSDVPATLGSREDG